MPKQAKHHAEASEIRPRIIRAALALIENEGFSAVTAPRLATEIGLRRTVIYYYFQDIDQVLIEAVMLAYQESKDEAISSIRTRNAKEVLWDFFSNAAAPLSELIALAIRNERFKAIYTGIIADFRSHIVTAIQHQNAARHAEPELDPESLTLLIQIVSSAIATERRLGLSAGHSGLKDYIEAKFIRDHSLNSQTRVPRGRPKV